MVDEKCMANPTEGESTPQSKNKKILHEHRPSEVREQP